MSNFFGEYYGVLLCIGMLVAYIQYKVKVRKQEDEFHEQNDDFE